MKVLAIGDLNVDLFLPFGIPPKGKQVFVHDSQISGGGGYAANFATACAKIPHIDIESPVLNEIIKPNEATFANGKEGGVFIGLKREMLARLEKVLERLE
jgi:hypothetical protein